MNRLIVLLLLLTPSFVLAEDKPRLVVLLIFDQLRGDYLSRWEALFEEGGFKRLMHEGAWFDNCHYPYAYTITGPGHATISTGTLPSIHGVIGNEWYERKSAKAVNCVSSDRHVQVPLPAANAKKKVNPKGVSPERMLAPTFADALKDQLGEECKVVALSIKDRGAVLPGGKRPDACYWADKNGQFVTSSYYRDSLHDWVKAFNQEKMIDRWHGKAWLKLRPDLDYEKYSGPDEAKGEAKGNNQGYSFPHPLNDGPKKQRTNYYAALACSPFGNDVLLALAKKAIEAEQLGQKDRVDFLSISFSSNDLVGHSWGPDSQEVLDVTLRSDRIVKDLLSRLDDTVGKGKYVVALTADHGICPLPEVSRSKGLDARRIDLNRMLKAAEDHLHQTYPEKPSTSKGEKSTKRSKWLASQQGYLLYLNRRYVSARGLEIAAVARTLARWMAHQPGIAAAYTQEELLRERLPDETARMVRASFFPERSGDVMLVVQPRYLLTSSLTGTTHGSPWTYDTHVPLIAMGPGIKAGIRKERVSPEHVPVILSRSLGIKPPASARLRVPEILFTE